MNPQPDDRTLRELLQRLKAEDQGETPAFDRILRRPPRARDAGALRRWAVAGCSMAAILLLGLALALVDWRDSGRERGGRLAIDSPAAKSSPESDIAKGRPLQLDFRQLQASIDRHFEPYTTLDPTVLDPTKLEWTTPTDSLLAMNLDVSLSPE